MADERKHWRVLPFQTDDGPTNMAVDEAILRARAEEKVPNTIRFYRWKPSTASIGRNQSLNTEIDVEAAKKHGVDIVRRISGGGAVFHDAENEITYSVTASENDIRDIFHNMDDKFFSADPPDDPMNDEIVKQQSEPPGKTRFFTVGSSYHVITMGLVNGLQRMGVCVDQGVIHCPALFVNGRKISGNAQARRHEIILQHGTILLSVDPEFMYTILKAPEGVTRGHMVRSVKAKVTGVFDTVEPVTDYEFQIKMIRGFEEALGIKCDMGELTTYEQELVHDIKEKRYSDDIWLTRLP